MQEITHEITIDKQDIKFSSAHFTIFDNSIERLHGHNYQVRLRVRAAALRAGVLLDFGLLKDEARRLCSELDERLLLAGRHPELRIETRGGELEIHCRNRRWVVAADECCVLPIRNVTCECLAEFICDTLLKRLNTSLSEAGVTTLMAEVQESPGQGGSCERRVGGI